MSDVIPRKVALALRAELQRETPDQTPVEIPEVYMRPPSLEERLQQFVRGELSRAAEESGGETFEESDDFDIPDDDEDSALWSPYQVHVMREEYVSEMGEPEEGSRSEAGTEAPGGSSPAEPNAADDKPPSEPAPQASTG